MNKPIRIGDALGDLAEYPYTEEQSERFRRMQERDSREAADEDLEDLRSMTNKALSGVYGASAKAVALAWCSDIYGKPETVAGLARREDMEALRIMLRKVPDRVSG